jgi:hypothetical protein
MHAERSADVPLRPGRRVGSLLPAALAVAAVVLLLPATGAGSTYSPHGGTGMSWTNGVVLCQFNTTAPGVAVSAFGRGAPGMTVSEVAVSEVAPNASVVASAVLHGASWNVTNLSSEAAYALGYAVHAPMASAVPAAPSVGSADLRVAFVLADDEGSAVGPTDTVEVLFSVANWSWQAPQDHLVLSFVTEANVPAAEHLASTTVPGWIVTTSSNASGSEVARLGTNATAVVTNDSEPASAVAAASSLAMLSPATARVTVTFGAAGEYSQLAFVARVGVVLPATVAGIPIDELLAALAAGGLVSAGVAVVTRSVRRRPSKLIYVEEESP